MDDVKGAMIVCDQKALECGFGIGIEWRSDWRKDTIQPDAEEEEEEVEGKKEK